MDQFYPDCYPGSEINGHNQRKLILYLYENDKDYGTGRQAVPLLEADAGILTEESMPVTVEWTRRVEFANFLIYPYYLDRLFRSGNYAKVLSFFHRLPHFDRFAHKHVFFLNDDLAIPFFIPAVTFRTSVMKTASDPHAEALAFEAEDFARYLDFSTRAFKHHVSFCGYVGSSIIRHRLLQAMLAFKGELVRDINVLNKMHFFIKDQPAEYVAQRRRDFLRSIRESMLVLCPRGLGMNSIRFFETLSMGRIPVLISDDVMLPFEREINYDKFILRIPEQNVAQTPQIILKWLEKHSMEALINKCVLSRMTWQQFFSKRMHARRILECLEKYHTNPPDPQSPAPPQRLSPAQIRRILQTWMADCIARNDLSSATLYHSNYINAWPRRLITKEMMRQNKQFGLLLQEGIRKCMEQFGKGAG